jgi:hypothetical protein
LIPIWGQEAAIYGLPVPACGWSGRGFGLAVSLYELVKAIFACAESVWSLPESIFALIEVAQAGSTTARESTA